MFVAGRSLSNLSEDTANIQLQQMVEPGIYQLASF
jgi:hypothetical protein